MRIRQKNHNSQVPAKKVENNAELILTWIHVCFAGCFRLPLIQYFHCLLLKNVFSQKLPGNFLSTGQKCPK